MATRKTKMATKKTKRKPKPCTARRTLKAERPVCVITQAFSGREKDRLVVVGCYGNLAAARAKGIKLREARPHGSRFALGISLGPCDHRTTGGKALTPANCTRGLRKHVANMNRLRGVARKRRA